jgi:lipoprotein signal peptidase
MEKQLLICANNKNLSRLHIFTNVFSAIYSHNNGICFSLVDNTLKQYDLFPQLHVTKSLIHLHHNCNKSPFN